MEQGTAVPLKLLGQLSIVRFWNSASTVLKVFFSISPVE
jgi:hypothetical protein